MAQPTDNSDHPNELPAPELNPLLNPLLGEHMGRWAEVYFTSPPEKREQAVSELLRELELQQSSGTGSPFASAPEGGPVSTGALSTGAGMAQAAAAAGEGSAPQLAIRRGASEVSEGEELRGRLSAPRLAEVTPDSMTCSSCGFENPAGQRFCGMCGTRLSETSDAAPTDVVQAMWASAETNAATLDSNPPDRNFERPSAIDANEAARADSTTHVLDEFPWRRDEISLFRIAEEVRPRGIRGTLFADPIDGSTSYRRYLLPIAVVVILAAGYGAWRTMQNQSGAARPAAPAAQEQAPTFAPAADTVQSAAPDSAASSEQPAAVPAKSPADVAAKHEPALVPAPVRAKDAAIAGDPSIPQTAESSSQDLATARSYLEGTNGHPRSSSEAAGWLWRAVGKQNAEATLLLSDLYLKGDGVAKNCDQAHILLDAAARKGEKEAAERLRHLQAFGCQ